MNIKVQLGENHLEPAPLPRSGMSVPEPPSTLLRIGALNVASFTGKTSRLEALMDELQLDLLFVSETWTAEGQARRYSARVVHALEHKRTKIYGHVPYGQAIMVNPNRLRPSEVVLLEDDVTEDRSYSVLDVRGVKLVCAYLAPSRTADWFLEKLTACADYFAGAPPAILLGDLNARHVAFGDTTNNTYGTHLLEEAEGLGLTRLSPIEGRWTFKKGNSRSIVDHVFANDSALGTTGNLRVHEKLYVGGTEHRLITFETRAPGAGLSSTPCTVPPWNRMALRDPEVRSQFRAYCQASQSRLMVRLQSLRTDTTSTAQARIDAMDQAFTDWVTEGLRKKVGRNRRERPSWASLFMTDELRACERVVEHLHDQYEAATEAGERAQRYSVYERHRQGYLAMVAARKREMYGDFRERLVQMNRSEVVRVVSSIRRNRGRTSGPLLRTDEASLAGYADHFARQFVNQNPVEPAPLVAAVAPPPRQILDLDPEAVFHASNVSLFIKDLANGKATGQSGLPAEALKVLGLLAAQPLSLLFQFIWEHKLVPSAWCRARIQPVPKKGDMTKIANYRPISLIEIPRKLFEAMLMPAVKEFAEPLAKEQGGFRAQRGTLDQIATLQEWIAQCKAARLQRFMAFLDIKAAYDQVDRAALWDKCASKGAPAGLVAMLKGLFDRNSAFVAVNGSASGDFPIASGVLQGSLLSPILYSVFIDDLACQLNAARVKNGISIGGRQYSILLYADDIVVLSNTKPALERLLQLCERHSVANRYRFNVQKCEVVASSPCAVQLYGQTLPSSPSFTYLGCPVTKDGIDWKRHSQRMGSKALTAADTLCQGGVHGRGLGVTTALAVFRTFLRPVLEYGLALMPAAGLRHMKPYYGRAISWLSSAGKGASSDVIGLFGGLEPFEARHERLGSKFYLKASTCDRREFAVGDAYGAFQRRRTRLSAFTGLSDLPLVRQLARAANRAAFQPAARPDAAAFRDMWTARKETLMSQVPLYFKTGYVFGGLDAASRPAAVAAISVLPPQDQHRLMLWCLNRGTGKWLLCRHCRLAPATKAHVEACILGIATVPLGPSNIEDRILDALENAAELARICQLIKLCLGDQPDSNLRL